MGMRSIRTVVTKEVDVLFERKQGKITATGWVADGALYLQLERHTKAGERQAIATLSLSQKDVELALAALKGNPA